MRWIFTSTVDPTKLEGVVSSRCGRFVAYSRSLRKWFMVYPGGETPIAEPEMILVDEDWARANRNLSKVVKFEKPRGRRRKSQQLILDL